jgi:hypothetical protein
VGFVDPAKSTGACHNIHHCLQQAAADFTQRFAISRSKTIPEKEVNHKLTLINANIQWVTKDM